MKKIDNPETTVMGNAEITDMIEVFELKILEIKSTYENCKPGLETYYGISEDFPGIKYSIARSRSLGEYAVVSALKIDFDRWKLQLDKLPNNKKDNNNLLKIQEETTLAYGIGSSSGSKLSSTFERYRAEMINAIKRYPDELRLYVQYRGKEKLKKLILLETDQDIKKILNRYLIEICLMIDPDFQYSDELTDITKPLDKILRRPNNTHNQQFALLENLGVIDYLKDKYNLPGTKMGELIANIINRDVQNTRVMVSFTDTKECESKKQKNKDVIDPILIKSGIIQTE